MSTWGRSGIASIGSPFAHRYAKSTWSFASGCRLGWSSSCSTSEMRNQTDRTALAARAIAPVQKPGPGGPPRERPQLACVPAGLLGQRCLRLPQLPLQRPPLPVRREVLPEPRAPHDRQLPLALEQLLALLLELRDLLARHPPRLAPVPAHATPPPGHGHRLPMQSPQLGPHAAEPVVQPEVLGDVLQPAALAVPRRAQVVEPPVQVVEALARAVPGHPALELAERARHQLLGLLGRV